MSGRGSREEGGSERGVVGGGGREMRVGDGIVGGGREGVVADGGSGRLGGCSSTIPPPPGEG